MENKTVQISLDSMCKLDTAINTVNELSTSMYARTFGYRPEAILQDKDRMGNDQMAKAFFWFLDNYEDVQSFVLAVRTISEFAQEFIPDYH